MDYVILKFLGDEFQISKSLNQYLELEKIFSPITEKILNTIIEEMKFSSCFEPFDEVQCLPNKLSQYKIKMIEISDFVIEQLYKYEIYNITESELLNNYKYYDIIKKMTIDVMNKCLKEIEEFQILQKNDIMNAFNYAANRITGSGIGIISNSFSTLAIHSAIEYNIIKSQVAKAEEEYQLSVKKINSYADNFVQHICTDILVNDYYPNVIIILTEFINDTVSGFYAYLTLNNKFDFDSISNYSMKKSDEMLKNIHKVSDKKEFLKQAFLQCPFNPDVYKKCLELELLDAETLKTAKYFNLVTEFSNELDVYYKKLFSKKETLSDAVKLYMCYKDLNEHEALREIYKIADIENKYFAISNIFNNNANLKLWIQNNITNVTQILCEYDDYGLKRYIDKMLDNIMSNNEFNTYKELNLLNTNEIPNYSDDKQLSDINAEICSQLMPIVLSYVNKMKLYRTQCLNECQILKQQYDDFLLTYNTQINSLKDEVSVLMKQKKSLNIFTYSRKKSIIAKLNKTLQDINELKKSEEEKLIKLQNDYEEKLKQVDVFI